MRRSRILVLAFLLALAAAACKQAGEKPQVETQTPAAAQTLSDPVCGMRVTPAEADTTIIYNGVEYGFCTRAHYEQFQAAPEKFVKPV